MQTGLSIYKIRPCPCGSGKDSQWQMDVRGIALCRTCVDCHDKKMSTYNCAIVSGDYDYDEAIEYQQVDEIQ